MNMQRAAVCFVAMALLSGCETERANDKSKELQFDQLPMVVRRGVEVAYPDAQVKKIVQDTNRETGVVQYKVHLTDKDGVTKDDVFAPDGSQVTNKVDYKAAVHH